MTQEHLAAAAGIGRVTLVRIERGEQSPRYGTLVALAEALGCPMATLLETGHLPSSDPYRALPQSQQPCGPLAT